jgi:type IV pilus assembly protein PilC
MAKFRYNGLSFSGQQVEGELVARNESELRQLLQADGIVLNSAHEQEVSQPQFKQLLTRGRQELVPFTRQMATMLSAGVSIDRVLTVLTRQAKSGRWRLVLSDLGERVRSGSSLSEALAEHPDIFDTLYVSLVKAGESSGELAVVLERLASFLENSERVSRKVKAAFLYPLAVLIVSIIVVLVLLIYIIPLFQEMFANLHAELPRMTKVVMGVSDFVRGNIVMVVLLLAVVSVLGWWLGRSTFFKTRLGSLMVRLPVVGNLIIKSQLAHFCRTCETLLIGGVQLPGAILLGSATARNLGLRTEIQQGLEQLKGGRPLHSAWDTSKIVPPIMAEMVQVGEETGKLPQMLGKLAQMFSDEVDAVTPALTAILEPVLIVGVGILVAGILISMYLPLFELINQLG